MISTAGRPFFGRSLQMQVNDILSSIDSIVDVQKSIVAKQDIEQEITQLLAKSFDQNEKADMTNLTKNLQAVKNNDC